MPCHPDAKNTGSLPDNMLFGEESHAATLDEDSDNIVTVFNSRSSFPRIAVLPDAEKHSLPVASTDSYTRRTRPQERSSQTHANQATPIEIYTVYAYGDERFFSKIDEQLGILHKQGWPISCHENEIIKSTTWQKSDHLATAHIILLLVSATFLNSVFCYCKQMHKAVERQQTDKRCCIIPIILRPINLKLLENTPFGRLESMPRNGKPISDWSSVDKAYAEITGKLMQEIESMKFYM